MTLRRVPGSRNYFADDSGFQEIALSDEMSDFVVGVAETMAGNSDAVGDSEYEAKRTIVRSGWNNERRQGASVEETKADWKDARDAILLRTADAMKIRNPR